MKQNTLATWIGSLALLLMPGQSHAVGISPADLRRVTSQLQDGDLIFTRISNPVFRQVAKTTDSWETHVGILFAGPNGTWQVAESKFPLSKCSRLDKFIARSEHGRFYIIRYRDGLTAVEKAGLRAAASARMGILYDLGFNYNSPRLYCSKFVYDVYRQATGYQVGKLQTFRQLLAANPQAPVTFWRAWFFGRIPWQRQCITTTSELKSADFIPVFDSLATQ
jgi:hypothetical protein